MIRVAVFLVLTAAFAFIAVWIADHPGQVAIDWLGYRWAPPIGVLLGTVAAIACATVLLWSLLRMIVRAPGLMARALAQRRAARGQLAIALGLVAVGAGDMRAARKFTAAAGRLAGGQPLQLLLEAQTAQLSGERDRAEAAFRAMADRTDTKLLGLHGLFIEARRRGDIAAARALAEDAARASPSLAWAGQAALEFRCIDGDWPGALDALERNRHGGLLDRAKFRRQRAVLLTARALSLSDRDHGAASELAQEAARLCPGLVPAAALAGRLLAEAGEPRKAGRMLEAAWRENPHPDIAGAYADLVPGASARDRLSRMRALKRLAEGDPEGALAVAAAALEAHEFAEARASLAPLLAAPTKRVATLMARLEEAERGDTGRAREWIARAVHAAHDPAWTADGLVAETWMPVSPVTGRLDAFQWRVPVADLAPRGPLIVQAEPARRMAQSSPRPLAPAAIEVEPVPVSPSPATVPQAAAPSAPEPTLMPASGPEALKVHAPDDPGPEPETVREPVPKPSEGGVGGWRSWFSRGRLGSIFFNRYLQK